MLDVTQVLNEFGGYEAAQTLFGVSRSLLARWELEGLPPKRWTQLARLSEHHATRTFTVEELAAVRPSRVKQEPTVRPSRVQQVAA